MTGSTWLKLGGLLATALVGLPVVVLAVLSYYSRKPTNVGLVDGWLADCPDKPNCVCSQALEVSHRIAPIDFSDASDTAWQRMKSVVSAMPHTKIVSEQDGYLHAECQTSVFRFVDDLELLLDAERQVIHCRSASRVGHSDFGVNRRRIEGLRRAFAAQTHP
ncbi:MAG TPA: DUF1499 domain-containing protein [Pirellulales bacterium]|nr:DUF1499 domain-containing protein [Pirellulales bacterium]